MDKLCNIPIRYLKGIGPQRAKVFNRAGIANIEDLLYYFPHRYEDRTALNTISQVEEGQVYTLKAKVLSKQQRQSFRRRRFSILELKVGDISGRITCVWFNQPYLNTYFTIGQDLILHGKAENYGGRLQISAPEFEILSDTEEEQDESPSAGRIVPVYSLPEGLTQRHFRKIIKQSLDEYLPKMNDFLTYDIRSRNNLLNLAKSLVSIHFPGDANIQKQSYERLSFEEFLLFQIPLALRKLRRKEKQGIAHIVDGNLLKEFIAGLPFQLTAAQQKVIDEIGRDMASPKPMQRLLQGDVGSGKTVVALAASLSAIQGAYQTAFMVPTEILARQHLEKIKCQVSSVKYQGKTIKIGLLVGSLTAKEKDRICRQVKDGEIDLLIGTHALLEGGVEFKNLGLVVIDEQHKFGVAQRALLPGKGKNPDILIMTATPIPRTLAITMYGDLDISVIKEMPKGRKPIATRFMTEDQRQQLYRFIEERVKEGRQAYIVYPVIESSYVLDVSAAEEMYKVLSTDVFPKLRIGLVHGRLKSEEQDRVMDKFRQGAIDILVSTTVLEVGIDVANASVMVIENAERFGLSQLHQLRGRIGRGPYDSFCILTGQPQTEEAKLRIKAIIENSDGFRIAEEDLKIRGPGEFFGKRQHGLTELRIANPLTQMHLLKKAREEAVRIVNKDPKLGERQNLLLREKLLQRFPGYEKLMVVG